MKTIVSITPIAVASDSRTYKIATSLAQFGYQSIVVEGLSSGFNKKSLPFQLIGVMGGILFTQKEAMEDEQSVGRSLFKQARYLLRRLVKPFANQWKTFVSLPKASLYYLHSFYQFPAVFLKSRLLGVPYFYDAHDYYLAESPGKFNRWLEALCIKHAKAVVTVSSGIAEVLQKEYGCEPIVIRNCHDPRLEERSTQDLRRYLGLSSEDFLFVVVGQAKDGMAICEALEAMKAMPANVHLAFVGKNTTDYSVLVEQAQLGSRVHLVPPVVVSQVVPFVRTADAALILYYPRTKNYENCLPNGFFQSISAKLPLVYAELRELHRIAEKYKLGIAVNTQSPKELQAGMLQLIRNPELRQTYKQNLELATQELSWEHEENVLRDLVAKVMT